MKNHSLISSIPLLIALLVATGCPKKNPPQAALTLATPKPALADAPSLPDNPKVPEAPTAVSVDLFKEMDTALEAATAEKHDGLSAVQQRMDREIDGQVAAWKASGHNVSLADDQKLDTATEDFAEKLRMLTLSSPEVWESAKHNTELALQSVRSAYAAIMNKPAKK